MKPHKLRLMSDSVTPSDYPKEELYLGYVNGNWPTYWDLPKNQRVGITVQAGTYDVYAQALDVEPGDATIDEAVVWAREYHRRFAPYKPILYISASSANELTAKLRAAGMQDDQWYLFTAHWTGHEHLCNGDIGLSKHADLTQYLSTDQYDLSVVSPHVVLYHWAAEGQPKAKPKHKVPRSKRVSKSIGHTSVATVSTAITLSVLSSNSVAVKGTAVAAVVSALLSLIHSAQKSKK